MQFSLKTLLLLFLVLATSFSAFGPAGIVLTIMVVPLGIWFRRFETWDDKGGCLCAFLMVVLGFLFLFWPWVRAGAEDERRREEGCCGEYLWYIGRALQEYHNANGCFPPAYVSDAHGRRMHSWRTLLLPYMHQQAVYQAYDFKQPWDGPNNCVLTTTTDSAFFCRDEAPVDFTRTDYFAVTGPGTAWPGERGSKLDEFTDEPERTILLVELTGRNVRWAEPRDVTLDEVLGPPDEPTQVPRSHHRATKATMLCYFFGNVPIAGHVLMADGSVLQIPGRLSREDLAALLSISGGEPVDLKEMLQRYEPPLVDSLRWDHVIGLPLFLVSVVWFWLRLAADARMSRTEDRQDLNDRQDLHD